MGKKEGAKAPKDSGKDKKSESKEVKAKSSKNDENGDENDRMHRPLADLVGLVWNETVLHKLFDSFVEDAHSTGSGGKEGVTILTNYRIMFVVNHNMSDVEARMFNVPYGCVASISSKKNTVRIDCKDVRYFSIRYSSEKSSALVQKIVSQNAFGGVRKAFAFKHGGGQKRNFYDGKVNEYIGYLPEQEYHRMGIPSSRYRLCHLNKDYTLCNSYPDLLVVPAKVSDEVIIESARFRHRGRIPVVAWVDPKNPHNCIARCSQPEIGLAGLLTRPGHFLHPRSYEDEHLVAWIRAASDLPLEPHDKVDDFWKGVSKALANSEDAKIGVAEREVLAAMAADYAAQKASRERSKSNNTHQQSKAAAIDRDLAGTFGGPEDETAVSLRKRMQSENINAMLHAEEPGAGEWGMKQMMIVDPRPRVNAHANYFKGGGFESDLHYEMCSVQFGDIGNIHVMRKSFKKVEKLCLEWREGSGQQWLHKLHDTQWMEYLALIMSQGVTVARLIRQRNHSVLVHCSDGWDRTTQLIGLAELMLDPYYRTMAGFITLIEKDWLSFGHQFAKRLGTLSGGDEDQRSPVFLQWLDCVHQFLLQFPNAFEFNEEFLIFVMDSAMNCRCGNFLFDSDKERSQAKVPQSTVSAWGLATAGPEHKNYCNPYYRFYPDELYPSDRMADLRFWSGYFLRYNPTIKSNTRLDSVLGKVIESEDNTIIKSDLIQENSMQLYKEEIRAQERNKDLEAELIEAKEEMRRFRDIRAKSTKHDLTKIKRRDRTLLRKDLWRAFTKTPLIVTLPPPVVLYAVAYNYAIKKDEEDEVLDNLTNVNKSIDEIAGEAKAERRTAKRRYYSAPRVMRSPFASNSDEIDKVQEDLDRVNRTLGIAPGSSNSH